MGRAWIALLLILVCGLLSTSPKQQISHRAAGDQPSAHGKDHAALIRSSVTPNDVPLKNTEAIPHDNCAERYAQKIEQWWRNFRPDPNWVTAIFTVVLAGVGAVQARIYLQQKRIMQNGLRPRLILREAFTDPNIGQPVSITFSIENTGGSAAEIVRSNFSIDHHPTDGRKRQVDLLGAEVSSPIPSGHKIQAGANYVGSFTNDLLPWDAAWAGTVRLNRVGHLTRLQHVAAVRIPGVILGDWSIYFFGRISYMDGLGVVRSMAFYRVLDFETFRLIPLGDPQLEWADERP